MATALASRSALLQAEELDPQVVEEHVTAMLAFGDRSPGSAGAGQTLDYIADQLTLAGIQQQARFSTPVGHQDSVATLTVNGTDSTSPGVTFQLQAHIANGGALATTGDQGIHGSIIDLRQQSAVRDPATVLGAVVIVPGYDQSLWQQVAKMGAAAVIFAVDDANRQDINNLVVTQQFYNASIPLPRFFADLPDTLPSDQGHLVAVTTIDQTAADSLLAIIPGSQASGDTMVLAAGYESSGRIPGFDPATTRAWNAATLLTLAQQLAAQPAENDVLIVFHGARVEHFRGLRTFLNSWYDQLRYRIDAPDIQWTDAPMGDVTMVRLIYRQWRAQWITNILANIGDLDQVTEQQFTEALSNITETDLPHHQQLFAGLDYPPDEGFDQFHFDGTTIFSFIVALIAIALVVFGRNRINTPLLTSIVILLVLIAQASYYQANKTSGMLLDNQRDAIAALGLKLVSDTAGNWGDATGPLLDLLRDVRVALQRQAVNEKRLQRDNVDESKVATWRKELALTKQRLSDNLEQLITSHDIDLGSTPELAAVEELITIHDAERKRWRTLQQKYGSSPLVDDEIDDFRLVLQHLANPDTSPLTPYQHWIEQQLAALRGIIAARSVVGERTLSALVAIDLSDGNNRYIGLADGMVYRKGDFDNLYRAFDRTVEQLNRQRESDLPIYRQVAEEPQPSIWGFQPRLHAADICNDFLPSITLMTALDQRTKIGSPADTPAAFQRDNFIAQLDGLAVLTRTLANAGNRPLGRVKYVGTMNMATIRIETESEGSATGTKGYPSPFVYVQTIDSARSLPGDVQPSETHIGDSSGQLQLLWLPRGDSNTRNKNIYIHYYGYDEQGFIVDAPATRGSTRPASAKNPLLALRSPADILLQIFPAEITAIYDLHDPRALMHLNGTALQDYSARSLQVMSASRDGLPNAAHVELDQRAAAAIFTPAGIRLRALAGYSSADRRLRLLGHHRGDGTFQGLPMSAPLTVSAAPSDGGIVEPMSVAVARDGFEMAQFRLQTLQDTGINPDAQWRQLAESELYLNLASGAIAAGNWQLADAYGFAAWSHINELYPSVMQLAQDVVIGLLVMLLLAIPFATICERLFVSGSTITTKVGGFIGFFLATFFFFYFLHPAFELATTPVIIFLAFTIITMSSLVIAMLYSRFENEMKLIAMAELGQHSADVSRIGTLLATGQLGISNMRRRPLRTGLTATTVVLMTFILMTFASFNTSPDVVAGDEGLTPTFSGVELHHHGFNPIPTHLGEKITQRFADQWQSHQRWWLVDNDPEISRYYVSADKDAAFVEGIVGIGAGDPSGIEAALVRGPILDRNAPRGLSVDEQGLPWIFLPEVVLLSTGLKPGGQGHIMGHQVRIGTIDEHVLAGIRHLAGSPLTPLAGATLSAEERRALEQAAKEGGDGASGSQVHLSPNSVAIVPSQLAAELGASVRSIALLAKTVVDGEGLQDQQTPLDLARTLAAEVNLAVYAGDQGSTYRVGLLSGVSVGGGADIVVPLILGGMIIFSTMLGSVAERGKEIFIYASLGLAPLHIAALFLVEAAIYAVIGGMGGYILAQSVGAGMGLMADWGWLAVRPDINFSSFTAVITILIVMATVLVSALYPAWMASQSAKPGEDTDIRIPEPENDRIEIPFPFTVAARDIRGLLAYLTAYFDMNTESSAGSFTSADAAMSMGDNQFTVTARIWLAPFDLGISQAFTMRAEPTEVPAIYRVHISLALLSGQRSAWRRVNMRFIKVMRQQFLVWRTLDSETMDRYRAKGGDEKALQRLAELEATRAGPPREAEPPSAPAGKEQPA